jgi:hypothetical protein
LQVVWKTQVRLCKLFGKYFFIFYFLFFIFYFYYETNPFNFKKLCFVTKFYFHFQFFFIREEKGVIKF